MSDIVRIDIVSVCNVYECVGWVCQILWVCVMYIYMTTHVYAACAVQLRRPSNCSWYNRFWCTLFFQFTITCIQISIEVISSHNPSFSFSNSIVCSVVSCRSLSSKLLQNCSSSNLLRSISTVACKQRTPIQPGLSLKLVQHRCSFCSLYVSLCVASLVLYAPNALDRR